jgi:hypothetical protein
MTGDVPETFPVVVSIFTDAERMLRPGTPKKTPGDSRFDLLREPMPFPLLTTILTV